MKKFIKMLSFLPVTLMAYILDTQQIHISEYPDAFNPSIIEWHGRILMSFRNIANPKDSYNSSEIGVVWLNEAFEVEGKAQILLGPHRFEDARLIEVAGRLYMIYSGNEDPILSKGGFRVYVAELTEEDGRFAVISQDRLVKFEGENPNLREKNWTPFVYQDHLLLSYSLNPHVVLKPLLGTGECETVVSKRSMAPWQWGDVRGGTQMLPVEGKYLTFFHSCVRMASDASQGKEMLHYFMGAATVSEEPPFTITHISPSPIVGSDFFTGTIYQPYWGSWRGIFPGGFIIKDDYIWIAYGKQNHELWVVRLDKKGLLSSLIPVLPGGGLD